jgi:hypothetical protein
VSETKKITSRRLLIYFDKIGITEADYFSKPDRERTRIRIDFMSWLTKHKDPYLIQIGKCMIIDHDDFNNYLKNTNKIEVIK